MTVQELVRVFVSDSTLLGDYVSQRTGSDVAIARFQDIGCTKRIKKATQFTHVRSTAATIRGLVLGVARVYWAGPDDGWTELAQERMKVLLNGLSYRARIISYDDRGAMLRRRITARASRGQIEIDEILFFSEIARVRLSINQDVQNDDLPSQRIAMIGRSLGVGSLSQAHWSCQAGASSYE